MRQVETNVPKRLAQQDFASLAVQRLTDARAGNPEHSALTPHSVHSTSDGASFASIDSVRELMKSSFTFLTS
jgi:hypothetical protein